MNTQELVKMAMQAVDARSARKLAERIGVSHVAVGKWMRGENYPTFEQAAELAEIAGLPVVKTAAEVRQSAEGGKHRKLLHRLATAAAVMLTCTAVLPAASEASTAQATANYSSHNSPGLYIM